VGFGFLSVCLTSFAREALILLSTPSFYEAALAVGPLCLGMMAAASMQVTALAISLTKQTKYFAILSGLAAALNLILNVLLIPRWGMMAASWSTTISYFFLTLAYLVVSQRLWAVAYEKRRVVSAVAITIVFVMGVPLLPELTLTSRIILKVIYGIFYVGFLALFQVLDRREWHKVLSIFRRRLASLSPSAGRNFNG
jgi:O-antigen/teichoic acid export membrane protein